jgi:hypothetical protein
MSVISLGEIAYMIQRRTGLPAVQAARMLPRLLRNRPRPSGRRPLLGLR